MLLIFLRLLKESDIRSGHEISLFCSKLSLCVINLLFLVSYLNSILFSICAACFNSSPSCGFDKLES